MARFRASAPFTTPMKLLIPTYRSVKGVPTKTFPSVDNGELIFGSFRTFGGTETVENDLLLVQATGYIDTWYRPDIKSDCRVYIIPTGQLYEILGEPENISLRNQYIKMRVQMLKGGA